MKTKFNFNIWLFISSLFAAIGTAIVTGGIFCIVGWIYEPEVPEELKNLME